MLYPKDSVVYSCRVVRYNVSQVLVKSITFFVLSSKEEKEILF